MVNQLHPEQVRARENLKAARSYVNDCLAALKKADEKAREKVVTMFVTSGNWSG